MYAIREPLADRSNDHADTYRLCRSCVNQFRCVYAQDPDKQVMFCDEFEGMTAAPIRSVVHNDKSHKTGSIHPEPEPEEEAELMGLCKTCVHRKTCTYKKPEGGVWLCEEFE